MSADTLVDHSDKQQQMGDVKGVIDAPVASAAPAAEVSEKGAAADTEKTAVEDPEKGAAAPPAFKPPQVPDGGWRAWSTVAGAWLVLFCTFGYVNAFGVYEAYYLQTTGESASNISWIGSLQLFFQFGMGAIVGPLYDKGYFRSILIIGSLGWTFSLMMVSLGTSYYQFILAQGVAAAMFLPTIGVISQHFLKRRALASGIVVSGSSCGGIMLNQLFSNGTGFAWGVRASAFLILGLLTIAILLMSDRFKELGIHKKAKPDFKGIIKDPVFLYGTAGFFAIVLGLFIGFFYVQVWAESQNLGESFSFYTLAIVNAASVFGRTIPNLIADKIGPFNMLGSCAAITGVLCLVMPAAKSKGGLIVWCIFYGCFSGSYISYAVLFDPGPPLIKSQAIEPSVVHHREESSRDWSATWPAFPCLGCRWPSGHANVRSLTFGIASGSSAHSIGAILGADKQPQDYDWWGASSFAGVMVLAGSAFIFVTRMLMAKRKGSQKV